jgi:hypothetical protein
MRYVQICAAPVLTAAFLALWPISATAQQNWQRYVVAETGGSVDVPTHIFSEEVGKPEAGHGALFQTSDRRANLTVQSLSNDAGDTPSAFLAKKRPPPNIVYRRVTSNFFVVSSFKDDLIWYNRCNFGGRSITCVLINYPAAEKKRWDAAVTRISNLLWHSGSSN